MTNRIEIKFDERLIDKIKTGEKYTTMIPANKLRDALPYKRVIAGDIVCVYKHPDLELSITKVETTNLLEIIRNPSFWLRGGGLSDYHNPLEFLALWQEFYGGTEYDMSNNPAVVVIYFSCNQNQKVEEQDETKETTLKEAYKILRRYQDCQDGYDFRPHIKAGLESIGEAIDVILQNQGLGNPITDCFRCRNHDADGIMDCRVGQVGECHRFEPEDEP